MKIQNVLDDQLFVYSQLLVYFSKISHLLQASDAETAHSKHLENGNLEFFVRSAVCLLSAVY